MVLVQIRREVLNGVKAKIVQPAIGCNDSKEPTAVIICFLCLAVVICPRVNRQVLPARVGLSECGRKAIQMWCYGAFAPDVLMNLRICEIQSGAEKRPLPDTLHFGGRRQKRHLLQAFRKCKCTISYACLCLIAFDLNQASALVKTVLGDCGHIPDVCKPQIGANVKCRPSYGLQIRKVRIQQARFLEAEAADGGYILRIQHLFDAALAAPRIRNRRDGCRKNDFKDSSKFPCTKSKTTFTVRIRYG